MSIRITRIVAGTAGLAAAGALVLGAAGAANAATPAPTPSPAAHAHLQLPLRAISVHAIRAQFGDVPSALKTDLGALKGAKDADRRSAVAAIEGKALDGSYGDDVKSAAAQARTAWASAPAALKSDLRALHGMSAADRAKARAAIAAKAVDGTYGSAEESYAKAVRSRVEKQQAGRLGGVVGSIV